MYGLPKDINLQFLKGVELLQVCVGVKEVIANFTEDISITIQCAFIHKINAEKTSSGEDLPFSASSLLSLLGHRIDSMTSKPDGELVLTFSNGETLTLLDDSREYESYTICNGDKLIVV